MENKSYSIKYYNNEHNNNVIMISKHKKHTYTYEELHEEPPLSSTPTIISNIICVACLPYLTTILLKSLWLWSHQFNSIFFICFKYGQLLHKIWSVLMPSLTDTICRIRNTNSAVETVSDLQRIMCSTSTSRLIDWLRY